MEGQLKNGTILTSESGNKYEVVSLLGAGGQGEVYDVKCSGNHYALKWYFKGSATERQKKILETIIAKGSPDESFLWPMELIVPAKSPALLAAARWRTALNFGVTYAVLTALGMLDPDALGLPWQIGRAHV